MVSFTNCFQLLEDRQTSCMIDAALECLLKAPPVRNEYELSIYLPGRNIPAWFTYQNSGPLITIQLPLNWYNNKFMGFAGCVVSDLITECTVWKIGYLQKIPGLCIRYTVMDREEKIFSCGTTMGFIGSENIDSEHTCLSYLSFDHFWSMFRDNVRSPSDLTWFQVSPDIVEDEKEMVPKAWGIDLVYEKDVKQDGSAYKVRTTRRRNTQAGRGVCAIFQIPDFVNADDPSENNTRHMQDDTHDAELDDHDNNEENHALLGKRMAYGVPEGPSKRTKHSLDDN
ncbi:hypothetical protein ACH5RR_038859 [Cinchona calisaya]|uniref:C-JID domain-containing protein n=1 Tax=Cinchona calisaya TaxID=153742 RepID=A0ABD2XZ15_9GENT